MDNNVVFSRQIYKTQGQPAFTNGLLGNVYGGVPIGIPTNGKEWVDTNFLQNVANQQGANAAQPNILQPQDAYFQMNSVSPQENFQGESAQELRIADGSQPATQATSTDQSSQPSASDVAGAVTQEAVTRATNNPQAGAIAGTVATAAASNVGADAQGTQAAQAAQAQPNLAQGLLGAYADTPAARYFDQQLASDYQKQLDTATLPYRLAQYDANDAAIRRAHPDTVMGIQRQLIQGLEAAKAQYDQSKAAGDEKGMALSHQAAEQLRAQAQAIGFDLGDYGGNEDTNAMAQALANNDARAYAAVIDNDMTPEQYYQQLYNRARNSGMGRKESEGYAQAHTEQYQAERNARMQSAFYTYGIQNGAITPYGMQILTKWAAGEDPQAFLGITTKAFGLPIDNFKLGAQRQLASDQNGYTMQQIDAKSKASMAELMQKIAGQFGLEQLRHQFDIDTLDHKFPMDMALASVRASRSGGGDSSSKSSSSSGSGKEFDKGQREILNEVGNKFENVKSLAAEIRAEGGNNAPAELHQQLRDAVGDLTDFVQSDDVSKAFPPDQREELGYYAYGAQFYLGKANGYEGDENNGEGNLMKDACHQLANNVPEDWLQKHMGYTREDFGDWVES
ncbi:MAG: hypothetical protein PUE51_07640 [Veillonellaceae bacterium]|nr:hypothetical protein [Veillonellaceae bacterium]